MIGNPKWFNYRKFGGWGITPNCWQGWAYLGVVALPLAAVNLLHLPDMWPVVLMIVWYLIFSIDLIDIMIRIRRDERDTLHEALAERNALWFMILALIIGLAYKTAQSAASGQAYSDPVIIIALVGAMLVKAATHLYLRDK